MALRHMIVGCALASATFAALAHDTWFETLPASTAPGGVALALGTGKRFPRQEFPLGMEQLVSSSCRDAAGALVPLRHLEDRQNTLWLRAAVRADAAPSCWAQVQPFEVEIAPRIVERYLKEIQAPAAVREAWAEMQQRGVTWTEHYTKHARVELPRAGVPVSTRPVPMAMDVLLSSDDGIGVDRPLGFQVLRDGRPLPDFPVELQNAVSGLGIWRRTDAHGRVLFSPPLPGRWILRGTDLRLSDTRRDQWESRFVTLAFDVPAASSRQ